MNTLLDSFSRKQRQAWLMRYRYGWRMKRIALELGMSVSGVSRLLLRTHARAGLPRCRYVRIIRTKPRLTGVWSLSRVRDV